MSREPRDATLTSWSWNSWLTNARECYQLEMFQATSKQPTESESPRDAYHNSARSGCPFRPQACIKPEGSLVCKQTPQNFKRHLPWSPSCCTFYHLASLQPDRGTAASHWISKHITKCCRRLHTNLAMIQPFKSHLTLVPWHTSTVCMSLTNTQLQAIVHCHLCLSVVLTPQAFARASGLLGLCHQL